MSETAVPRAGAPRRAALMITCLADMF